VDGAGIDTDTCDDQGAMRDWPTEEVRPRLTKLPEHVRPMLATLGERPKDDANWSYEMKWDGVRAIAYVQSGRVRFTSRNDIDVTVSYPELHGLAEQLGETQALFDGEIVSFDDAGRPSFKLLQQRMHVASAATARRLAENDPAVYLIFDLLHLDGRNLFDLPYTARRELLEGLELGADSWQTPPAFKGDGAHAVAASKQRGLEGVMAKRSNSRYLPGRRSPDWVKIKNFHTQEVVIGGWSPGKGRRKGTVGALLLGVPTPEGLRYVGQVGTGFTDAMLHDLAEQLRRIARKTPPFSPDVPRADARDAQWVTPELVGEVAFSEWTGDRRLRHPSWRGLRSDKGADEVVFES
jgi:bifunctional non-homologous end joining protein LigD